MDTTPERWLPVVGWEGLYEVSDFGRVRSLPRLFPTRNPTKYRCHPGRILVPCRHLGGHYSYPLGRKVRLYAHRLVLEAFVGPCPEGLECCHNDGDPTNNRLENLRWDTHRANGRDRSLHQTHCKRGHEFTPDNTYTDPSGGRRCRECRRSHYQ